VLAAHALGALLASAHGFTSTFVGPRSEALRLWLGGSDLERWSDEPWRLLTAGLVHVTLAHLLTNAVVILAVGRVVESLIGGRRLVGIAVLGVLAGSLTATIAGLPRVDGASAGAFALVGAGIAVGARWPLPADDRRLLGPVFGVVATVNLAASFFAPSLALSAHTGGLLAGLLVGSLLRPDAVGRGWAALDVIAAGIAPLGLVMAGLDLG
jgi:rhomboid protease GluP